MLSVRFSLAAISVAAAFSVGVIRTATLSVFFSVIFATLLKTCRPLA
nr:MAG TPA: hypothetical protein [Caudoviricetes sp.]